MDLLSLVPNSQILLGNQPGSKQRHENQMLNTLQMAGLQDPSIQQAGLLDNRIPNPAQGTLQALLLQREYPPMACTISGTPNYCSGGSSCTRKRRYYAATPIGPWRIFLCSRRATSWGRSTNQRLPDEVTGR
ncbi:hypothetical protein R1flu_015454 [Riccia fluitans]|uniref:Uncharacterized protein n=1 Tax=Riccia fluitans TaxID=41844 RepID=A0ABD1YIZ6_9MARC